MDTVILHIDEEPRLPRAFAEALAEEGYRLMYTSDPEEAIRIVRDEHPALVLMEIALETCDGLDLMAGIRSPELGGVPVLVLTSAQRGSGLHGEAIALGAVDFLGKDVGAEKLLAAVREIAPPVPEAEEEPAPHDGDTEISGSLADSPMPELLARLRRRGASGVLVASRGRTRMYVQLRNGSPIQVASNRLPRPEASELRDVDEDDYELEIRMRAEAALFESFGWSDGSYRFVHGKHLPPDDALDLARDPASLLLIGVLDVSPLEQVRERLRMRGSLYAVGAGGAGSPLEGVELTSVQEQVLADLDGSDTLDLLLESKTFDERLLYGLWVAGRIELDNSPTIMLTELFDEAPADADAGDTRAEERKRMLASIQELARRVMAGDDFDALGVPLSATEEQVQAAYEGLLRQIPEEALDSADPELCARATRLKERIELAYAHLMDEEKRRAHTLLRKEAEQDKNAKPSAERALEGERWFRKGKGMLKRKAYDEAVEAFGMASHLDPAEGEYRAHLGYALFLSKPNVKVVQREAIEHVASGIKTSPKRELPYVYLGRILKAQGDLEGARKVFRRAVRIKPDCHAALQELRLLEMRDRKGKGVLARLLKR